MSGIVLVAVFCIFAGVARAQENPKFVGGDDFFVEPGTEIELTCAVDSAVDFLVRKQMLIVHKSLKTGTENTVSEQGSLMKKYQDMPENYKLQFLYDPNVRAILTLQVTDDMDGQYICQIKSTTGTEVEETAVATVTVAGGVEDLEMTVGNSIVTDVSSASLKFREGQISVTCTVTGTNPEPLIHLYLGDEQLNVETVTVLADPDSPLPRRSYRGTVSYLLDFKHTMFGKPLRCHAETDIPEGVAMNLPDKTVSRVLKGIVDAPVVRCSNNTAGRNDRGTTLKCLVSKEPKMKSVSFRLRDQVIYPGNITESMEECYQTDFNATFIEVVLKFYKMEDWHFTANIYFDVAAYDGNVYQYPVFLLKGDDNDVSAAPSLVATVALPAACLLAFLLNCLI